VNDPISPLVRHADEIPDEQWNDPRRGGASWRTFFSRDITPTTALTTGVSTVPPGQALAPHRHKIVESYFFIHGHGVLALGGDEYEVDAGSAVHIPSLTVHGVRNTGSTTLQFFYVFATDSFADVEYEFPLDMA
jgi:mannose-6-phosphate isomerase-like protein (cupin superfamily)